MIDALQRRVFLTCLAGDFIACEETPFFPLAGMLYGEWTKFNYGHYPAPIRIDND